MCNSLAKDAKRYTENGTLELKKTLFLRLWKKTNNLVYKKETRDLDLNAFFFASQINLSSHCLRLRLLLLKVIIVQFKLN